MSLILLIPLFFAGVASVFAIGWLIAHITKLDEFNELEIKEKISSR